MDRTARSAARIACVGVDDVAGGQEAIVDPRSANRAPPPVVGGSPHPAPRVSQRRRLAGSHVATLLGTLAVTSMASRDYLVVQVLVLLAVAVAALIQILTELVLAWLDPRVRLGAS